MRPKLEMVTPLSTPMHEAKFKCSACGKEFMFVAPFGGGSAFGLLAIKRGAGTYLKTRFDKHVERYHPHHQP